MSFGYSNNNEKKFIFFPFINVILAILQATDQSLVLFHSFHDIWALYIYTMCVLAHTSAVYVLALTIHCQLTASNIYTGSIVCIVFIMDFSLYYHTNSYHPKCSSLWWKRMNSSTYSVVNGRIAMYTMKYVSKLLAVKWLCSYRPGIQNIIW